MADFDWIAEARRIGHWEPGHPYSDAVLRDPECTWEMIGFGDTEQDAARDAVLRAREFARRVLPEHVEAVELLRGLLIYQDMGAANTEHAHLVDTARRVLARIDAKEPTDV